MELVKIERRGRIAIVRLDRGDGRNALSLEACRQLTRAARSFDDDPDVSAVVLTGTAEVFSLGADLRDPEVADRFTELLQIRERVRPPADLAARYAEIGEAS